MIWRCVRGCDNRADLVAQDDGGLHGGHVVVLVDVPFGHVRQLDKLNEQLLTRRGRWVRDPARRP